jgi:molybdopterin-containing oxidoreductase family iron-sulfur binding subunit
MKKETSRREFLAAGLLAGLAAGCSNPFTSEDATVKPSGEKVKLLSVDGEEIEVDKAFLKPVPDMPTVTNAAARVGIAGKSFVMVIDLSRCKNLKKCQSACDHMHHVHPGQNWIKVDPMQDAEHTAKYWQPTTCMHCDEPPCVKVCPVDATFKRIDGIVGIDNNRCIGCRFCMVACPYSARIFNWDSEYAMTQTEFTSIKNHEACSSHVRGTVEKCDFCPAKTANNELADCVKACPNGVFYFGDENEDTVTNGDETVSFTQLIKDRAGYRFLEELGTKPRVYYLPPQDWQFPVERGYENLPDTLKQRFKDIMEPEKKS